MGIDKFWGILDPKSRPRMKTMNPEPLTLNPPFLSNSFVRKSHNLQ
jgi:hypothetical protein